MEARAIPSASAPLSRARERATTAVVPWPLVATVFAATSIVIGLIWDISWHMSIGRDTFWTPAHFGIYIGGIVAGLANGALVLKTTFAGTDEERSRSVRFWGFRGPIGSWIAIWGSGAMLTSAPFDNWWHDAYGLDVEILSPPHTILLLGIVGIVLGAAITALTAQNRAEVGDGGSAMAERAPLFRGIYAYAAGVLLTIVSIGVWEDMGWHLTHSAHFYRAAAFPFPFFLAAIMRSLRLRWPATTAAAIYMAIFAGMTWVLPLFSATPKLGPIYQDITHFVPMGLPVLLIVPAFFFDLVNRSLGGRNRWLLAAALAVVFVASMLAVHWPFGSFMVSKASHNWLFAGDNYPYFASKTSNRYLGRFAQIDKTTFEFWTRMLFATATAFVSARLGLGFGDWMRRVRR